MYQVLGIIFIFLVLGFLMVGSWILQRDKYYTHIWHDFGEPKVKSIKELKSYIKYGGKV
jgi:hypothetical protein